MFKLQLKKGYCENTHEVEIELSIDMKYAVSNEKISI